jgi:hypothetical protein
VELVSFDVPFMSLKNAAIPIIPLGDIQYTGMKGVTAIDTLKRVIAKGQEIGAYYIGMGDYIDAFSPSNRQRLRGAALYDTAEEVIDDAARALTEELYRTVLKPTTGRWIGLLEGHHFAELKTGQTTDQYLCELLQARFLGTSAFVRLQLVYKGGSCKVVLWAHHGSGGGAKACAPLNKMENIAPYWGGVDVFLMGHTTKGPVVAINRVEPRWSGPGGPELVHRKVFFVSTGGFARSYTLESKSGRTPRGGYAEQRMLPPSVLGTPIIRIRPKRGWRVENGKEHQPMYPDISVEI